VEREVASHHPPQLFDDAAPGCDRPEVISGLDRLRACAPLRGFDGLRWKAIVQLAIDFAWRWDKRAQAHGWGVVELYGLHPRAPAARLSAMGAAFLLAVTPRWRALSIGESSILISTGAAERLRFSRQSDPESRPAWELISPG
jgi:hypothetical protein